MGDALSDRKIGLALSGGGLRAVAFHAGVLRRIAELGALESVRHVSTVSGGSLFVGLMMRGAGYRWPTSREYAGSVFNHVRTVVTGISLEGEAWRMLLFDPRNWKHVLSRAHVMAAAIERFWDVRAKLGELPKNPIWSINSTTAEDARRFRFRGVNAGDGVVGYADAPDYPLAHAMMTSAAFPVTIGPLKFRTGGYNWRRRQKAIALEPGETAAPDLRQLHLYDGGLYDNLGLEPLWDMGSRRIHQHAGGIDFLLVSSAIAPIGAMPLPGLLSWRRAARLASILGEQSRSLRVRALVNALLQDIVDGLYVSIGGFVDDAAETEDDRFDGRDSLTAADIARAVSYPTSISRMSEADFDLVARLGYEVMQARETWLREKAKLATLVAGARVAREEIDEQAG